MEQSGDQGKAPSHMPWYKGSYYRGKPTLQYMIVVLGNPGYQYK